MSAAQNDTQATTERTAKADKLVTFHTGAAITLGLVPLPLVDLAALTGIQLNLIRSLAKLYELEFKSDLGKSLLTALVGGSASIGTTALIKVIPVVGTILGGISFSAVAGASTYAAGKVFLQHFESGGTFLTFDPDKVRDHYARQYADRMHKPASSKEAPDYAGIKP